MVSFCLMAMCRQAKHFLSHNYCSVVMGIFPFKTILKIKTSLMKHLDLWAHSEKKKPI